MYLVLMQSTPIDIHWPIQPGSLSYDHELEASKRCFVEEVHQLKHRKLLLILLVGGKTISGSGLNYIQDRLRDYNRLQPLLDLR